MARKKGKRKTKFITIEELEDNLDLKRQDAEFLEAVGEVDKLSMEQKLGMEAPGSPDSCENDDVGSEETSSFFKRMIEEIDSATIGRVLQEKESTTEFERPEGFKWQPVRARLARARRSGTSIDLHGLKKAEALDRLQSFLSRTRRAGERMVLVITGYGKHSDMNGPVLREAVIQWLKGNQGRNLVSEIYPAPPEDGGPGAFYLFLRPNRRKTSDEK